MNEEVIMLLINDDANVKELTEMGVPMVTAYRYFSRRLTLIETYEKAHKKLAAIRRARKKVKE